MTPLDAARPLILTLAWVLAVGVLVMLLPEDNE